MFVGAALIELHLPGAASLKDKRQVVKGLKDRLKARHGAAVAEVDAHDRWQRSVLLVSVVGCTVGDVEGALEAVRRQAEGLSDAQCVRFETSVVAFGDLACFEGM